MVQSVNSQVTPHLLVLSEINSQMVFMGFLPSFPNSAVLGHKLFQKYFQKKKKVNGEHTILSELRGSELNKLIALEMMYFHILPNKSILLRNFHKKIISFITAYRSRHSKHFVNMLILRTTCTHSTHYILYTVLDAGEVKKIK